MENRRASMSFCGGITMNVWVNTIHMAIVERIRRSVAQEKELVEVQTRKVEELEQNGLSTRSDVSVLRMMISQLNAVRSTLQKAEEEAHADQDHSPLRGTETGGSAARSQSRRERAHLRGLGAWRR